VPLPVAAERAQALGFAHIDVPCDWNGPLALPIGDRMAHPSPRPHCSCAAPPAGEGMWERAVAAYRRTPGVRIEPWPGSICGSNDAVLAMLEEVPGLELLVDTGHVATWGGDPVELLPWAGHVQLRQARQGEPQTLEGDVDLAAVLDALERLGYRGLVSIEYFDLPEYGWPLDDPVAHAVALAEQVWALG
jgi:sugar phosphate isomerase/epimerase